MTASIRTWTCPDTLTIYEVSALQRDILTSDALQSSWQFDLSAVIEIDSAGLQLLLYFANQLEAHQHSLTLCNIPDAIQDIIDLAGLHERFIGESATNQGGMA